MMPFVLVVTMALFIGIVSIVSGINNVTKNKVENRPLIVGLAGDTENEYIRYASAAVSSLSDLSVSFDLVVLGEEEAKQLLYKGEISAYVIIPDDFIDNVSEGTNVPLKFVTSSGADGVVPMFKEEISRAIIDIFVYSEKGVFGLGELMEDTGVDGNVYEEINALNFEYVKLIMNRTDVFDVEVLGASDGMPFEQYLVCGLAIFFLFLIGIPFATLYIKGDYSMNRVLKARGYSYFSQFFSEYSAHFISLLTNVYLAIGVILLASVVIKVNLLPVGINQVYWLFVQILPIVVMICSFNMLVFELSGNLVSGILMHFFITLSACYASGCFYPTYAFPKTVAEASAFLPTGIARDYFANVMREERAVEGALLLLGYTAVFFVAAIVLRRYKTTRRGTV